MKALLRLCFLLPTVVLAADFTDSTIAELRDCNRRLEAKLDEIKILYQDDPGFLPALEVSEKKWVGYCQAMEQARFPAVNKQAEYGTVYFQVHRQLWIDWTKARIADLTLWTAGTEEGDVSSGSVKLKSQLDKIRNLRPKGKG